MKEKDKLILIDERMDKMTKGLSEVRVRICLVYEKCDIQAG